MRILTLEGSGVKTWGKGSFNLDLRGVNGVIAVCGRNGAGKTLLFELLGPAMMYRDRPTRTTRDLDAIFHVGGKARLEFLQGKDRYLLSVERRASDYLCHVEKNGKRLDESTGKVRAYDQLVQSILGPSNSFYASVYGAQGGVGGLRDVEKSERKNILTYYLGLDRVAALHKVFADELREAKKKQNEALQYQRDVEITTKAQEESKQLQAAYEAELSKLRERLEDLKARCSSLGDVEAARREMTAWQQSEGRRLGAISTAKQAHNEVVARRKQIEADLAGVKSQRRESPSEPKEGRDLHTSKLRLLERELRERAVLTSEIEAVADKARSAKQEADLISKVPCKAEGKYEGCKLLSKAIESRDSIDDLRSKWTALREKVGNLPTQEQYDDLEKRDRAHRKAWAEYDAVVQEVKALMDRKTALEERLAVVKEEEERARLRLAAAEAVTPLPRPPEVRDDPEAQRLLGERDAQEMEVNRIAGLAAREQGRFDAREEVLVAAQRKLMGFGDITTALADLELIVKGLGPAGLRALEMDVAGPELTDLANEILAKCLDGRFSCKFVTFSETNAGTIKEDLDVLVYEASDPDTPRLMGDLSGGEGVVVDEAIRSALAIFANSRLERPFATLWRDELGSALDSVNRFAYVDMLRQAGKVGEFHQVFFIYHDPEVVEAADHVIEVTHTGPVLKSGKESRQ